MATEITANGVSHIQDGAIQPADFGSPFFEHNQTISSDYTIATGKNAGTFGEIEIATNVTVTISTGANWVIV